MACSPEQLAANRRNSKLSTGPKTPEGKARSRRNGLKHGLTGDGIVIADEDVEAVQERFEAFEADLKPANDVARFLVTRAAMLSVRLDRSAREEAARINLEMLEAPELEEDVRGLEFEELTKSFAEHPAESVRKLRRSEEGIDWLIGGWLRAKRDLLEVDGVRWKDETAIRLSGRNAQATQSLRISALTMATRELFSRLEPTDWPDLSPLERKAAAKAEILAFIEREIAGLKEARQNLDHKRIAQIRAGAAARAIFNPSKDATLARKYEASAERAFFQTLKKIEAINATATEAVEVDATTEEEATCGEMASSLPGKVSEVVQVETPEKARRQDAGRPENASRNRGIRSTREPISPLTR